MNHRRIARAIDELLDDLRIRHRTHVAQTGTVYITIAARAGRDEVVIRFADHADCYESADYSVDPQGSQSARAAVLAALGTTESAIYRLRRARRSAWTRRMTAYAASLRAQGCSEADVERSVVAAMLAPR